MTNAGGPTYASHVTQRPLPHAHRISGTYETIPDPPYEHIGRHGNQNITLVNRTTCTSENEHRYHVLEKTVPEKQQSLEKEMETPPTNNEATPTNRNTYHVLEKEAHNEPQETTTDQLVQYNTAAQDYEVPSNSELSGSQDNMTEK